jgi:hypothetical protein
MLAARARTSTIPEHTSPTRPEPIPARDRVNTRHTRIITATANSITCLAMDSEAIRLTG